MSYYDNDILDDRMKEACNLASKSVVLGGGPFGAVITDTCHNIISDGHNMVTINNDPTQHAEIVAIREACSRLKTYNLSGYNIFTSCEPCPMCLAAIYWARIDKVYYGNDRIDAKNIGFDDEFIYDEIGKNIDCRKIPMVQINRGYAQASFQEWSDKTDKTEY